MATIKLTQFLVNEYTSHLSVLHEEFAKTTEELEIAKEKGDLSENAEYTLALNKLGSLDKEISDITAILKNSEIVERTMDNYHVDYGSYLVLRFTDMKDVPVKEKIFKDYPTIWNVIPNYGKFALPNDMIYTSQSVSETIDKIYADLDITNCKFAADTERTFKEKYKGIPIHFLSQDTIVGGLLYGKNLRDLPQNFTYIDNSSIQRKVWVLDHYVPGESSEQSEEEVADTNEFDVKGI